MPTTLDKQLEHIDAIVRGHYIGKSYKKLYGGQVITEAGIKVDTHLGLYNKDLLNKNYFKVYYPGGRWQEKVYSVQGAPEFTKGEEVVLLLKRTSQGHAIANLSMGKYKVIYKKNKIYLQSDVFPNHPKLGKIPWAEVKDKVYMNFGSFLKAPNGNKVIVDTSRKKISSASRRIAQVDHKDIQEKEKNVPTFWLLVIFASLGIYQLKVMRKG